MTSDQSPRPNPPDGAEVGWSVLSYLLGGIVVWGGVGWLIDRWLGLPNIGLLVGMLVGAAGAIYLIAKKVG